MYRLLLIAPSNEATDQAYWKTQNFDPVEICPDLHSAGERLASKKYDAVGVPDSSSYTQLKDLLAARNDCIPAFILPSDQQESRSVLRDVKHLLNRLHVDYFDGQYSLNELSRMIQYEMLHNLLAGKSNDAKRLIRWFGMLRSDIPVSKPCRVYSLSLPNGDLYLEDRWHHGQQRLQKALERNFFSLRLSSILSKNFIERPLQGLFRTGIIPSAHNLNKCDADPSRGGAPRDLCRHPKISACISDTHIL